MLQTNSETPLSNGPAIEAGTLWMAPPAGLTTPDGVSLCLPALIQLPKTLTTEQREQWEALAQLERATS